MRWVWRAESGAGAIEYGALVVLAGVIVAALITAGLPSSVTPAVTAAVCKLYDAEHCKPANGGPGGPNDPNASGDPNGGSGDPDGGSGDPDGGSGDPTAAAPGATQPADNGSSGDPELDGKIDEAQKEYDRLLKESNEKKGAAGDIDEELMDLLKELIGWEDAKQCFTEGDILACLKTAITALPWGKALKFVSKIPKAYKLFDKWRKGSKAYNKIKKKLDDQKKKLDDLKKKKKKKDPSCPIPAAADNRRTPNSFVPGTPVFLADGSTVSIEDIDVGDRVHAFDPRTGEEGPRPVTDLIEGSGSKTLVTLTLTGEHGGSETITATDEHPFWNPGSASWVDAEDLVIGSPVRTADGAWAEVGATATRTVAHQDVYNLTVADLHTYYIGVDTASALVHNDDPCGEIPGGSLADNDKLGGHVIDRHTGKSDEWLKRRALKDPKAGEQASTFTDKAVAEKMVGGALKKRQAEIRKWLDDPDKKGNLPLKDNPGDGKIGRYARKDGKVYDARHYDVILKKDPDAPAGYIVITAYPKKKSKAS